MPSAHSKSLKMLTAVHNTKTGKIALKSANFDDMPIGQIIFDSIDMSFCYAIKKKWGRNSNAPTTANISLRIMEKCGKH